MSIITVNTNSNLQTINLTNISNESYVNKIDLFNQMDNLLINVNKNKYANAKEIIRYIESRKIPNLIDKNKITIRSSFLQK